MSMDIIPKMVENSFNILDSINEYHKTTENAKTRREEIRAYKDIEIEKIKSQKNILETYLKGIFIERSNIINRSFDVLDNAIENNNIELIQQSLSVVVTIAKESPLSGVQNLLNDFNNSNVKEIEI